MTEKFRLIIYAGLFLGGIFIGWTARGWLTGQQIQTDRADRAEMTLGLQTDNVNKIHGVALVSTDIKSEQQKRTGKLNDEIKKTTALPVDCRPDDRRMRILADAVDSANSAKHSASRYRTLKTVRGSESADGS